MLRLITLLFAMLMAPAAYAQLLPSCNFSVTNMSFGNADSLSGGYVDTTAEISVTCSGLLSLATVRICFNINAGSGGATGSVRHMRNASNHPLNFQLYQNASRTTLWGSTQQPNLGAAPELVLAVPVLGSASASRTIYGRILPNQQNAPTGFYQSLFSGAETSFNYSLVGILLDCSTPLLGSVARPSFISQANVLPNCNVAAQNIDFGNYGVIDSDIDATGGITVTCTADTPYSVGLNNGIKGAGPTERLMVLGDKSIQYGLYMDPLRSHPWGNSGGEVFTGIGNGMPQSTPVYGRVAAQQTPPPGNYNDTVVVTVTY